MSPINKIIDPEITDAVAMWILMAIGHIIKFLLWDICMFLLKIINSILV